MTVENILSSLMNEYEGVNNDLNTPIGLPSGVLGKYKITLSFAKVVAFQVIFSFVD